MRLIPTVEINKLYKIYKPYLVGASLTENAPKEAIDAFKKYDILLSKQIDEEVKSWFA